MRTPDDVRNLIVSAFESVPIPEADEVIAEPSSGDPDSKAETRRILAGRHWSEFQFGPDEYPFSTGYLSPQAYQHYIAAILIGSFDSVGEFNLANHYAISTVSPSAHAVYYEGRDDYFLWQTSLLTVDQRHAIIAYLSLYLPPEMYWLTFAAARAYRLAWIDGSSADNAMFADFAYRMRNWNFTPPADAETATLCEQINNAFAKTPYPGDDRLSGSAQGDESAENALDLRGVDWRRAHPNLLAANDGALSFLSSEGFRYFIPAFMRAELVDEDGISNASPVFALTHGFYPYLHSSDSDGTDLIEYRLERCSGFTRIERQAIIRFLEFRAKDNKYAAQDISAALQTYWYPSLEYSA